MMEYVFGVYLEMSGGMEKHLLKKGWKVVVEIRPRQQVTVIHQVQVS